ncbi:hypothetical protein AB0K15_39500 [Amycolatopsis sp. NPDC049253]|uniref:hypothetical protein n=1 Tax=Amycolatopsis sp. NPDC049253 TaxID=3155274 RepID=UPI003415C6C0
MTEDLLPLLRPALSGELFEELVTEGHDQGLRYLIACSPAGQPPAAAGYRTLVTSRGCVLFIDDLVTGEAARSQGVGARLLGELKALAPGASGWSSTPASRTPTRTGSTSATGWTSRRSTSPDRWSSKAGLDPRPLQEEETCVRPTWNGSVAWWGSASASCPDPSPARVRSQ